ncbi:MAG: NAD-dependent epimerase/dehydratase family protein [Chloroflexota bacterium]
MKILILGGTRFLGRHLVDSALARGHEVTLFNRGRTNPDLFPQAHTIRGDRGTDLALLSGGSWDAVIDTCGYLPRIVRMSAQALRDAVGSYVFISSISVYADFRKLGISESDAVGVLREETEQITDESYGPLKALCEQAVRDVFDARALIMRPGLIVGPQDPTDRFTYWPVRVARGGEVLAPDRPDGFTQVIDARDLSDFIIHLIEEKVAGTFNATGLPAALTFGELLETCKQVSGSEATIRWASAEFLAQNKVAPWSDLPAWLPDDGEDAGFAHVDVSRAVAAGLTFRPLAGTVRDTLDWAAARPANHEWRAGLKPEREGELLKLM